MAESLTKSTTRYAVLNLPQKPKHFLIFLSPISVLDMENELKDLTLQQLRQRAKPLSFITWFFSGVLLLLFCVTLYFSLQKGEMTPLLVTPLALSPIAIINFVRLEKLKKEMKKRSQQPNGRGESLS